MLFARITFTLYRESNNSFYLSKIQSHPPITIPNQLTPPITDGVLPDSDRHQMVANLEGTSNTSRHYKLPTVSRWNSDQSRQIYLFVQPNSEMYYFSVQVQRFTSDAIALSTRQSACQVELRVSTKLRIRVKFGMKIAQSAIFKTRWQCTWNVAHK